MVLKQAAPTRDRDAQDDHLPHRHASHLRERLAELELQLGGEGLLGCERQRHGQQDGLGADQARAEARQRRLAASWHAFLHQTHKLCDFSLGGGLLIEELQRPRVVCEERHQVALC